LTHIPKLKSHLLTQHLCVSQDHMGITMGSLVVFQCAPHNEQERLLALFIPPSAKPEILFQILIFWTSVPCQPTPSSILLSLQTQLPASSDTSFYYWMQCTCDLVWCLLSSSSSICAYVANVAYLICPETGIFVQSSSIIWDERSLLDQQGNQGMIVIQAMFFKHLTMFFIQPSHKQMGRASDF
jgi:hypothetical protein